MDINFAYVTDDQYQNDIVKAIANGKVLTFTIDCAQEEVPAEVSAQTFQWDLVDGARRELASPFRLKQKLRTKPDLVLNGVKLNIFGKTAVVNFRQLLRLWWRSNSRWISTSYLISEKGKASPDKGLVRVVRSSADLEFQKEQGVGFLIFSEFEVETMFPQKTLN